MLYPLFKICDRVSVSSVCPTMLMVQYGVMQSVQPCLRRLGFGQLGVMGLKCALWG